MDRSSGLGPSYGLVRCAPSAWYSCGSGCVSRVTKSQIVAKLSWECFGIMFEVFFFNYVYIKGFKKSAS